VAVRLHEHPLNHTEVEVQTEETADQAKHGIGAVPGGNHALEDEELGRETGERRQPGQRQHGHGDE